MDVVLLVVRLILAGVFGFSAVTKFLAPDDGQTMRDFGVPERFSRPAGAFLPVAEVIVALALIPAVSARWGGLGALILLALFCAGIGVNLARGRTPDCHCFGQFRSEPIGWQTLARNGVLALLALAVLIGGGGTSWSEIGDSLTVAEGLSLALGVILLAALLGGGWLALQLLQQNGRLLVRLEALEAQAANGQPLAAATPQAEPEPEPAGLRIGTVAPAFELPDLDGETHSLAALRGQGQPVMLLFSDPGCGPCQALMPDIGRWQREQEGKLTIALISRGTVEANRAKSAEHSIQRVLLQENSDVSGQYQAYGTPSAVLVSPAGMIASPLAQGATAIRALVARQQEPPKPVPMANGRVAPPAPAVGEPAPALALPDLDGKQVDLAAFKGHPTLVLFWNPGCGFCQRLLPELKAWEQARPPESPNLLIVSTGTAAANRAQGLSSPVLLDQGFGAGGSFGAHGTPMGVLIDAEGKIASETAAGGPAVMALAGATVTNA